MNIAIDGRTLHENPGDGIGWFTYEIVKRMVRDHPEESFFIITDKKYKNLPVEGDNVKYLYHGPRNCHPLITYFWHQFVVPPLLDKIKADVLIGPDGIIPLYCSVPCISVIHDLNHCHRPKDFPFFTGNFFRYFFPRYAVQATRIATVSEYSKNDISETYFIDRQKIDVVFNGVAGSFTPLKEEEKETVIKNVTGGIPFFLFVSNFSPRKNVVTLVKAFERFCEINGNGYRLVLAGGRLYLNSELDRVVKKSPYRNFIIFTGSVNRDTLRNLYGSCLAFVFVSWFEGFGIPVVEAMRCGAPCIVSDNSSLPEVSGGAGLCVSASDTEAIAGAMTRIAAEPDLRRSLGEQGIENSKRFSWDDTAREMWNSVMKTLYRNA